MDKQRIDLLISARWLIPVAPEQKIYENAAIAIDNGKIIAIIEEGSPLDAYTPSEHRVLDQHIVIPGLINAHGHTAMSLLRGFADDLPLQIWLEEHIWPAEGQWVSADFVRDGSQLAIAEMLRSGTTCFSDMYFFPEETAKAAEEVGIRCQLNTPILDFPTAWGENADDYIDMGLALHKQYSSSELVNIGFGPHAPYTVSDAPLKRIAQLSREFDIPVQIHLHETADEVATSIEQKTLRPSERLEQLGLFSERLQCVHMTQVDDSDIARLHRNGTHVIHCPESNLKLASGFCPVKKLQDAGINVALGTDGAASNNDLDLLGEMRTASLLAKGVSGDASALNAHQALQMATLNGAKAMGLEKTIGSIEVGKAADITAISLDSLESTPLFNPVSYLAYSQCSHQVSHVWVDGKLLLNNRELQTLDEASLRDNAEQWAQRIGH